jgi:hypothetical protein
MAAKKEMYVMPTEGMTMESTCDRELRVKVNFHCRLGQGSWQQG